MDSVMTSIFGNGISDNKKEIIENKYKSGNIMNAHGQVETNKRIQRVRILHTQTADNKRYNQQSI